MFFPDRTRRLLKHSRGGGDSSNVGVSKVVSMLQSRETGEEQMMEGGGGGGEEGGDTIVLDTTAEFCRQIGEEDKTGEAVCVGGGGRGGGGTEGGTEGERE